MDLNGDQDLSIDCDPIKFQHQVIFQRINALRTGSREGWDRAELQKRVRSLEEYVDAHFEVEEMYMERCGYPDILAHKEEHEKFIKDVTELNAKLASLGSGDEFAAVLGAEMKGRFSAWLTTHREKFDDKLMAFMAKNKQPSLKSIIHH